MTAHATSAAELDRIGADAASRLKLHGFGGGDRFAIHTLRADDDARCARAYARCPGDERTVILEPPLSTGAGGRSPEKTSPGMVDRPSKRQGPGPGCGEARRRCACLAMRGSDRPRSGRGPKATEQGVRYAQSPARGARKASRARQARAPCSLLPRSQTLRGQEYRPARLQMFGAPRARRYPRAAMCAYDGWRQLRAGCGQSSVARACDLR